MAITKKEKDAIKKEELENKNLLKSIPSMKDEIDLLRNELEERKQQLEEFASDSAILKDLHLNGIIDDNGKPLI
jgi:molecular chaperone GrpE (heat shock protein)